MRRKRLSDDQFEALLDNIAVAHAALSAVDEILESAATVGSGDNFVTGGITITYPGRASAADKYHLQSYGHLIRQGKPVPTHDDRGMGADGRSKIKITYPNKDPEEKTPE